MLTKTRPAIFCFLVLSLLLRGREGATGVLTLPGGGPDGCAGPPKAAPQDLQVGLAICVKPHRGHLPLAAIGPSSSLTPLIL